MEPTTKLDDELRVRIPSELTEKLKVAAKKARRTVPDFVRISLEDACNSQR